MTTGGTFFERHWKWFVLGTLFYSTFLNYLDRQTLGVALDPIAQEFGLDIQQRGRLLSTFVAVYAFCHLFIGFALDRVKNLRAFFPVMLLAWPDGLLARMLRSAAPRNQWRSPQSIRRPLMIAHGVRCPLRPRLKSNISVN